MPLVHEQPTIVEVPPIEMGRRSLVTVLPLRLTAPAVVTAPSLVTVTAGPRAKLWVRLIVPVGRLNTVVTPLVLDLSGTFRCPRCRATLPCGPRGWASRPFPHEQLGRPVDGRRAERGGQVVRRRRSSPPWLFTTAGERPGLEQDDCRSAGQVQGRRHVGGRVRLRRVLRSRWCSRHRRARDARRAAPRARSASTARRGEHGGPAMARAASVGHRRHPPLDHRAAVPSGSQWTRFGPGVTSLRRIRPFVGHRSIPVQHATAPAAPAPDEPDPAVARSPPRPAGFRPDIEGLRAFRRPRGPRVPPEPGGWLPGGFVGVDVFFVVSGYLITAAGRRGRVPDRCRGRVLGPPNSAFASRVEAGDRRDGAQWPRPWWRRSSGEAVDSDVGQLGLSTGFAARSVTTSAPTRKWPSPLLHFWSLAVEEQFYLFWPLLFGCW